MVPKRKLYVVEFLGDLPRTRKLGSPESFYKMEHVFRRLRKLFLPDFGGEFPDPEDDRIVVWECDANTSPPTMKAVWAFNGWHWHHDVLPGMEDGYTNSSLPGCGESLYKMACNFFRV